MRLHNKLEINKNGESFVFYNNLLSGALKEISMLNPYFNYLCVGSGQGATEKNMEGLEEFICSFPCTLESYNINKENGNLFIRKSVAIDSDENLTFSEIGISAESGGENIVNRFLLPTAIDYVVGDSVTLTVTIYLEIDEASNMAFLTGNNKLLGLLLGHWFGEEGIAQYKFSMCRGLNRAETTSPVSYDFMPYSEIELSISPTIQDQTLELMLSGTIPADGGITEVIIALCGEPVLRVSNYDLPLSETTKTESLTANAGLEVKLTNPYVKEVTEVYNTTSSSLVLGTRCEPYGLECGEVNFSPFGEYNYSSETTRYVSPNARSIIFADGGRLDYYLVRYGALIKQDTSAFVSEGLQKLCLYDDVIVARYYSESEDKHFTRYYYAENGAIQEGTITISWDNVESQFWKCFSFNKSNAHNSYIIGIVTESDTYMGYVIKGDDDPSVMTSGVVDKLGFALDGFYVTSGSVVDDAYGLGYIEAGTNKGMYVFKNGSYTMPTSAVIANLLYLYGETPRAYNGFFYISYYGSLASSPRLIYYNASINKYMTQPYYSYTERLWWSADAKYTIEKNPNGIFVRYYTYHKAHYSFVKDFPTDKIPMAEIDDFEMLQNMIIVFRKDGLCPVVVPVYENYVSVVPVPASAKATVTYKTIVVAGADGNDTDVKVNIVCSIDN